MITISEATERISSTGESMASSPSIWVNASMKGSGSARTDAEAYIAGNVGSGSVAEMRDWVEYITLDGTSPMADLRKRHGREQPWRLPFFGVGNESWGCTGNMLAPHYAN